jgi:hypothetical protein
LAQNAYREVRNTSATVAEGASGQSELRVRLSATPPEAQVSAGYSSSRTLGRSPSSRYSADPFAFGGGSRLERSFSLVDEAANASGVEDIYKYVDEVTYETGSSYFDVRGGVRQLNIGSNAFSKTRAGQLIEASHEIGHAKVFDKLVKKLGFDAAYKEGFLNPERNFGQRLYAREEQLVERLARWRVRKYLGGLTQQQSTASKKYIDSWRKIERSFDREEK